MSVSPDKSAEVESAKRGSSFNLTQILGYQLDPAIPVYLPHNLTKDEFHSLVPGPSSDPAFTFQALQNWLTKLFKNFALQNNANHPFREHPYKLRELDVQAVVWFRETSPEKEGKLGFMKIQAKIETDPYIHGEEKDERPDWLPGAVFLRGGSVAILIILQPNDATGDSEKHVILTVQPRPAAASLSFTEIPAGMLDGQSFAGAAANEIKEEASLTISEHELINMSKEALKDQPASEEVLEDAMYPSAGACDEFIPLMLCQKKVTRQYMEELKGKATGLRDEGEKIKLKLVPLERAWKEGGRDAKCLAALALYEGLKREGKVPEMEPEKLE